MAATPNVQSSQGAVLALIEGTSPTVETSQGAIMAMAQFPAEGVEASEAAVLALIEHSPTVQASQANVFALARGRVFDPSVRAWTFTLDGHDMYVLRLGNNETLVYDLSTDTWYRWASGNSDDVWNIYNGANWTSGDRVAFKYGSNVLCGSDSNGTLYFLNPEKADDDSAVEGRDANPFTRRVTGQLKTRGYNRVNLFEVQLMGTTGELLSDSLNTVTLTYSDDRGDTYGGGRTITIPQGDYDTRASWRSLGSFREPGRLVRIEDNGALQRIDSLTVRTNMDQ